MMRTIRKADVEVWSKMDPNDRQLDPECDFGTFVDLSIDLSHDWLKLYSLICESYATLGNAHSMSCQYNQDLIHGALAACTCDAGRMRGKLGSFLMDRSHGQA